MAHKKFKDDNDAWKFLEERGFTEKQFLIQIPAREVTQEELDAVGYLVAEWDWGYENSIRMMKDTYYRYYCKTCGKVICRSYDAGDLECPACKADQRIEIKNLIRRLDEIEKDTDRI